MNHSLRVQWEKRLAQAQNSTSWRTQIEAKVLRFLLAHYRGDQAEAQLAPFPMYVGATPHGRAHFALSKRQLGERLKHIAQIGRERADDEPVFLDWDRIGYEDVERNRREEAWAETRRERISKRKDRGYW